MNLISIACESMHVCVFVCVCVRECVYVCARMCVSMVCMFVIGEHSDP